MNKHAAQAGTQLRVSRREVLCYAWGGAFALLIAAFGRMLYLFALPRPRDAIGVIPLERIPSRGAAPELIEVFGRPVFLTHTSAGVNALRAHCTHNGCRLPWSDAAGVFACPCHGSHFDMNGEYVAGPAPRALDRYALVSIGPGDKAVRHAAAPLHLPAPLSMLVINIDRLVLGKSHGHLGDGVVATAVPAGESEQHAPVP